VTYRAQYITSLFRSQYRFKGNFAMAYLDAAYSILKTAGQPLHFEEITERAAP